MGVDFSTLLACQSGEECSNGSCTVCVLLNNPNYAHIYEIQSHNIIVRRQRRRVEILEQQVVRVAAKRQTMADT